MKHVFFFLLVTAATLFSDCHQGDAGSAPPPQPAALADRVGQVAAHILSLDFSNYQLANSINLSALAVTSVETLESAFKPATLGTYQAQLSTDLWILGPFDKYLRAVLISTVGTNIDLYFVLK
ncbi:hypothetical protein GCM10027592_63080 [Spirosoma flavus]